MADDGESGARVSRSQIGGPRAPVLTVDISVPSKMRGRDIVVECAPTREQYDDYVKANEEEEDG